MARIGYVRVSTKEQSTARQEKLMDDLGVDKLFMEKASGKDLEREKLKQMLDYVREGDTVIVESYSRFGKSVYTDKKTAFQGYAVSGGLY